MGLVIPMGYFGSPDEQLGFKYGEGEIGMIILTIMLISAIIIIIGGSTISVVLACFAIYCVNVIGIFSTNGTGAEESSTSGTPNTTSANAS